MDKSSLSSLINFQPQLDHLFCGNDLLRYCSRYKNFKDKKIALIGSSPISLLAGNIFAAYGGNVTVFEKSKDLGGAWSSIKIDEIHVPTSTHIIMPNPFLFDLLRIFGVSILPWKLHPIQLDWDTKVSKPFPKPNNEYKGQESKYFVDAKDLVDSLVSSLVKSGTKFKSENIYNVIERSNGIDITTQNGLKYEFDLLFLTPAAKIKTFKKDELFHRPIYEFFENRTLIFSVKGEKKLGSRFFHIDGMSVIREIQTFEKNQAETLIAVKMSRYGSYEDLSEVKSILREIVFGGSKKFVFYKYKKFEYNNFRMTPSSQRKIMSSGKLKMMPCFGKTQDVSLSDADLMRTSQDLALCLDGKKFFDAINISQHDENIN